MPLLLLLPVLAVVVLLLWAVLLPLALWQRYRAGKARRRAVRWVLRLNAGVLLVSSGLFLAGAWLAGRWVDAAPAYAGAGWFAGALLGLLGLALTRFERDPRGLLYTPNRWLVLGLTLVVAARLAFGLLRAWQLWQAGEPASWLLQQAGLFAAGGLVLGYYLAYGWGLQRRLRAR